jgi:predicted RecA/RadA family phage recombinase
MTNYGPSPSVAGAIPLVRAIHGAQTMVDYTPAADVAFGAVVVQGTLAGVALLPIPANVKGALAIEGVFDFPKATTAGSGQAAGTKMYWDAANQVAVPNQVGAGNAGPNPFLGKLEIVTVDADTTARIVMESVAG